MRTVRPVVYRMRWLWLGLWLFGCLLGLAYLVEPLDWWQASWQPNGLIRVIGAYWTGDLNYRFGQQGLDGIFGIDFPYDGYDGPAALVTMLLFFLPYPLFLGYTRDSTHSLPAQRKPRGASLIAAAFMISLLITAGLAWSAGWFELDVANEIEHLTKGSIAAASAWPMLSLVSLLAFGTVSWIALQFVYRRRERYWQLEELTLWLMITAAALLLIVLLTIPQRLWWRSNDIRFHTARVLSAFVLLWALGARTALLFMLQKYLRARDQGDGMTCFACEYDLRGSIAAARKSCPECGAPIPPGLLARQANVT